MSWKLIGKPVTQKVTRKIVNEFSEMEPAPHDRPLSERRLQVYQRLLKEGMFRPVTWAKAFCPETNGMYRVNGKHTSVMLSSMDPLPDFYVTVEFYECDTLEDVAKLYSTFDSSMQSRTASDIYMSFAATINELKPISRRVIVLAVGGMSVGDGSIYLPKGGGRGTSTTAAERAELLLDHPEFVMWLNDTVAAGISSAKHLLRAPVAGAMFKTWQKSKSAASEFWSAVRDESGPSQNLPDRKLARYLLTVGVNNGVGATRARPVMPREMFVKSIHAWNAWRANEKTELKYYEDKPIPAVK